MPQIILEQSSNVQETNHRELLLEIHHILTDKLPTQIEGCKSRVLIHNEYVVGNGDANNGFVHLNISVLKGRSVELLSDIGQIVMAKLTDFYAKSLKNINLQITVQIGELPDVYLKTTT
ncbi:MAG: hypothetical protein JSR17_03560 [Proteobacteria bacterium]|nr:hypothetical protein [Pseudomonadota bacterium]